MKCIYNEGLQIFKLSFFQKLTILLANETIVCIYLPYNCGSSSVGRASAFQAECRRFEPGLPLKKLHLIGEAFLF